MELTRPKAILFDWDNTLVDTWPIIHAALHNTFVQMGKEPWTLDMVKQRVSRSMRDSFPEIFGENWQTAGDIYQNHFRTHHLTQLTALEGSASILSELAKHPVYLAVVSNKRGDNLRLEVEHIGWKPYFSKIIGASDMARDKPFPEPVHAALEGSNISAGKDVWFIGDSAVDMECAHATGCIPIWYGEEPATALAHPFKVRVANHHEFKSLIQKQFAA